MRVGIMDDARSLKSQAAHPVEGLQHYRDNMQKFLEYSLVMRAYKQRQVKNTENVSSS